MKLSLYEQETIILYNQAEATAEVYSHEIPGPDREKEPPDLHSAQTLRVGAGAVQRRAPQGCQRAGQSRRV